MGFKFITFVEILIIVADKLLGTSLDSIMFCNQNGQSTYILSNGNRYECESVIVLLLFYGCQCLRACESCAGSILVTEVTIESGA